MGIHDFFFFLSHCLTFSVDNKEEISVNSCVMSVTVKQAGEGASGD